MIFFTGGHLADIINVPNFIPIRLGVSILWGSNFWLSQERDVATHPGLNYRSACDDLQSSVIYKLTIRVRFYKWTAFPAVCRPLQRVCMGGGHIWNSNSVWKI